MTGAGAKIEFGHQLAKPLAVFPVAAKNAADFYIAHPDHRLEMKFCDKTGADKSDPQRFSGVF